PPPSGRTAASCTTRTASPEAASAPAGRRSCSRTSMGTFAFSNALPKGTMNTPSRILVCLGGLALGGLSLTAAQDKVTIPLTDPSQPVTLKVSVLNGGIAVKGASVKDVVVEAHVRERDPGGKAGTAHRIPINTTGLAAEEEDNVVQIGCDTTGRTVDLD